ncbi:MAG: DUF4263 domain-containing protein [Thermoanaerobaculia bacterium]|nr:DUF4263 domain-containing protein [Thermoanaerobaculia bacterium]
MANRDDLLVAIQEIFGSEIVVSSRAAAALLEAGSVFELFKAKIAIISDLEIFSHTIACSPACADILLRNGIDLMQLPRIKKFQEHDTVEIRAPFSSLVRSLFTDQFLNFGQLNSSGKLVLDSGFLAETDLFISCLEAGRSGILPTRAAKTILDPLGMVDHGFVTNEGELLLEAMESDCRAIGAIDPSHSSQQFLLFLDEEGMFRVRPFGANAIGVMDEPRLPQGPFLFRGGTLQSYSAGGDFSLEVLAELEELINSERTRENDLQLYFKRNPEVLAGLDFGDVHSQPILFKDDGSKLIPDFFLEKVDPGWDAILDLKKPDVDIIVRRKNRNYFSQWIQNAIAQLQFYREWFENPSNCRDLEARLGLPGRIFRPKMILVAGRRSSFESEIERIRLVSNQSDRLEFWTYDDVLARARRYRDFLCGHVGNRGRQK